MTSFSYKNDFQSDLVRSNNNNNDSGSDDYNLNDKYQNMQVKLEELQEKNESLVKEIKNL